MSRRPLYLLAPTVLACALGYFAWPPASAFGTSSTKERAAQQAAPSREQHDSAQQPMNGVAKKARYKLTFEHRSAIDGKEAVVVETAGTWTTIERAGGDIEAQFAASRIAIKGDQAPSNRDVADSFTLKMHDGGLLAVAFPKGTTDRAHNLHRNAAERNRRLSIVAGATLGDLLEAAKSAAHLGEDAPLRYREQAKAMRRLTALVELDPNAANELAAAIKKDPADLDSARLLTGALASAESPQATNALTSLLGQELPDETRSAVLMNLGLARTPTAESEATLTEALDGPLGNQAALALGNQAHTLGEEGGAGAVDTLLTRYEAAKTSEERLAYIEALANTGSREVLPVMHAAISGNDFTAARAGTLGSRLIPGDDVDDTLFGLIVQGSVVTLDAIKAVSYRSPSMWEPRLEKVRAMYQGENRVLEAIQAVLAQWASLKVAPPSGN